MNILAVDTTGEALSVALKAGEKVYSLQRKFKAPHDETLLPSVARLLKRAGLKMDDLDAIVAASGPGRFTGIRIGMAYAAVAALPLRIPALAVSRLEALAWKIPGDWMCAALRGYRDERYYQLFRRAGANLKPEGAPAWVSARDWKEVRHSLERKGAAVAEEEVSAADLLEPAERWLKRKRRPPFEPLYLKPAGYESKHPVRPVR